MDKPLVYQKKAEKEKNKVVIPKFFVNKWGYDYYMYVYNDKIILEPINKEGKVEENDRERTIG